MCKSKTSFKYFGGCCRYFDCQREVATVTALLHCEVEKCWGKIETSNFVPRSYLVIEMWDLTTAWPWKVWVRD